MTLNNVILEIVVSFHHKDLALSKYSPSKPLHQNQLFGIYNFGMQLNFLIITTT